MKAAPVSETPLWGTRSKKPLRDGRVPGTDGGVWLWRTVPLSSVVDAKTIQDTVRAGSPIHNGFEELANLVTGRAQNRRMVKSQYRQVHMLLVNIPTWFRAQPGTKTAEYLNRSFGETLVIKRMLFFGVRLVPTTGSGTLRSFMDSAAETLFSGGTPMSDYDKDFAEVDSALSRAGFNVPEPQDFMLANAWWNHGSNSDTPVLPHIEHMHYFRDMTAVKQAERAGLADCSDWPTIDGQAAITYASVEDFDLRYVNVEDRLARWAPTLLDAGARVISIRGLVEPARVTRYELRAQQRRYRNDIAEAAEKQKMDRAEREERESELGELENSYARDEASATLVDTSIIIGFDGALDDVSKVAPNALVLNPMANRQAQAWHETMICSSVRANPHLHDLPVTTIAYSGIPNISAVGDKHGALLGFTERDRQPVYISPTAASAGDAAPTMLVAAATGAGKLLTLDTDIPTPSGWTTMGQLKVGDKVLGRDGKPCTVTFVTDINQSPDLYRLTLSDGQVIDADFDHQWVVSTFAGRNNARKPEHRNAIARWEKQQAAVETLERVAAEWSDAEQLRVSELYDVVSQLLPDSDWNSPAALYGALRMAEAVPNATLEIVETQFAAWSNVSGGNAVRRGDSMKPSAAAAVETHRYDVPGALRALAARIRFTSQEEPTLEPNERVMTTGEMLGHGLRTNQNASEFAIRLTHGLELPEAELPVEPYILGFWLGGGHANSGKFTQDFKAVDDSGTSDRDWLLRELHSYEPKVLASKQSVGTRGLATKLRALGLRNNKHIPDLYLRASFEQRLALLQGLIDSDGHITAHGACELTPCNQRLAEDSLELIRSLGIKVAMTAGDAAITEDDPSDPGHETRGVGTRYRMHFTTTLEVARLPRKRARINTDVRETQQWLYITDITPIASRPGRCIQVDSPDSTYLSAGFVPTHNTILLEWLATQFVQLGSPTVIVDPKAGSDLSGLVELVGGTVASFDDFTTSDGAIDPLRFATNKDVGVQLASSMLSAVDPWGPYLRRQYETAIANAVRYGVDHGATATGQALTIARDAGIISDEIVTPVFQLAEAYPMFRATFGMHALPAGVQPLSVSDGLTLFKAGNAQFQLPPRGDGFVLSEAEPLVRTSVNALRMIVRGSMMALTGRGGVLNIDEAWVIEKAAPDELEAIGRLARSQDVLPILYTQTPSGPINLGLRGYISRGLIGHIKDPVESQAGLALFDINSDAVRERVQAEEFTAGTADEGGLNWNSLKALRNPRTREFERGSVFYHADLRGRLAPVEISVPADFLALASTTPEDVRKRLAARNSGVAVR